MGTCSYCFPLGARVGPLGDAERNHAPDARSDGRPGIPELHGSVPSTLRECGALERIVGATVAAAIEPVAVGASAAGRDRRGAAEVREGGFGLDPVKVVARADVHLAGDLGSNPGKGKQGGGDLVH